MEKERVTLTGWHLLGIALAALVLAAICCVLGGLVGGVVGYGLGRSAAPSIEVPTVIPLPGVPMPPEIEITPPPGERPYLGIRYVARARGAEVQEVIPGSPAEKAGLRVGDVILAVDDKRVTAAQPLAEILASYRPGDRVTLTVEREGKQLEIRVTLGRRP